MILFSFGFALGSRKVRQEGLPGSSGGLVGRAKLGDRRAPYRQFHRHRLPLRLVRRPVSAGPVARCRSHLPARDVTKPRTGFQPTKTLTKPGSYFDEMSFSCLKFLLGNVNIMDSRVPPKSLSIVVKDMQRNP